MNTNSVSMQSKFNNFHTSRQGMRGHHDFVCKQVTDNQIDDFFDTNPKSKGQRFSPLALVCSVIGVLLPVMFFAHKHNPKIKLNSLKNMWKASNFNYGATELAVVGAGGIIGGLAGGLADKNETKKLKKIKEATFQLMNVVFPTILMAGALKVGKKSKYLNNAAGNIAATAIGVAGGIFASVTSLNFLENKIFDKRDVEPNKKFKAKDLLVYADDCLGALVLAKVPLIDKLPMSTIIPSLFTWIGYNVGEKEKGH